MTFIFSIVYASLCGAFAYACWCIMYPYYRQIRYWWKKPQEAKSVPRVGGCWPVVGHGPAFSADIMGFIERAYEKYGPVFRLQVFRSEILVVCDRKLVQQYFRESEKNFSLYEALRRIYFGEAFSQNASALETIIRLVKTTIRIDYDVFTPKIVDEAQKMTQRLRQQVADAPNATLQLKSELIRFVARTSARCFICVDLSEEFFDILMQFTDLLNRLVVLTYFMPRWLIKALLGRKLDRLRNQMTDALSDEIDSYRNDSTKKDSLVFRKAVDFTDSDGKTLSNREVGEVVVCLLYVSSENTALGLTNCLVDLVQNPEIAQRLASQVRGSVEQFDFKAVFADTLMNACVMESARMNTHIFPLNRHSRNVDATLGDYYVGDAQCVAICEPMLMKHSKCAADKFKNPQLFNPDRFLSGGETFKPQDVMTWGAGTHLCPGQNFAIYEIKTALALLLNTFEFHPEHVGELQYFSPSAYAEREFDARLQLVDQPVQVGSVQLGGETHRIDVVVVVGAANDVDDNNDGKTIAVDCHVMDDGEGNKLWLLRQAMPPEMQRVQFIDTVKMCAATDAAQLLLSGKVPPQKAFPIGYNSLVYTGQSNVVEMLDWKAYGQAVWTSLSQQVPGFPADEKKTFNSVYVQMYHKDGTMKKHRDQHVDWGVSVSLGASCQFQFGDKTILLHSGDVVVCDFSRVEHAVETILTSNLPGFVNNEVLLLDEPSDDDDVDGATVRQLVCDLDRVRCSVQIRDTTESSPPVPLLTDQEFLQMLLQ